jgi:hypothetical protein
VRDLRRVGERDERSGACRRHGGNRKERTQAPALSQGAPKPIQPRTRFARHFRLSAPLPALARPWVWYRLFFGET